MRNRRVRADRASGSKWLVRVLPVTIFLACAGGEATTATTDGSATGSSTSTTSTSSTTSGSTSSTGSSTTDETTGGCHFLCQSDHAVGCVQAGPGLGGEVRCFPCDLWKQDCKPGWKCTGWAYDGGDEWDEVKCVPVGDDKVGEPCTVAGAITTGLDTCELGAMCWYIDPETLEGVCVALCEGSEAAPTCADPNTACLIGYNDSVILCLPTCDPLVQDCGVGETCTQQGPGFHCVATDPAPGGFGEPCESGAGCSVGLTCVDGAALPGCRGAGCCSPYCKLSAPECPGMPALSCVPYFGDSPPEGLEDLGVCAAPP